MRKTLWLHTSKLLVLLISAVLLTACNNLPWQKQFSGLDIQMSDNSTAQIYLSGLHLGQAPLEKRDIKPGTYTLRIEPTNPEKQAYETQVHLSPNTLTSVLWSFRGSEPTGNGEILELEPLASQDRSELSVITVPEGAKISLNEKSYGLSPVVVEEVTSGQYELSIEAVAHVKKDLSVKLQPGYRLHVFSRLEKEAQALTTGTEENEGGITPETDIETEMEEVTAVPSPSPSASPQAAARRTIPTPEPEKPYVQIKDTPTGWLRVRAEASSAGEELAQVDVGGKFPYKSSLNGWYEIEYEPGKSGWVSGQYASVIR